MFARKGKCNIIIDGQFGSTGKGLIAGKISTDEEVNIFTSDLSPNAGHTFCNNTGKKIITKQLPVGGILNTESLIYLNAGSAIDLDIFFNELDGYSIDTTRIKIHPHAVIVTHDDKQWELQDHSSVTKIASTQSGTGHAFAQKVLRNGYLAKDCPQLKRFLSCVDLMDEMDKGKSVVVETSQGLDLGINSCLEYPYCTSREISVAQALSNAQVHPSYLGNTMMCIRTFPIRVGHIEKNGNTLGISGPFYKDSIEISWDDLDLPPEYTTVTNRMRRIATFSYTQFERSFHYIKPTHIFVNFMNYLGWWTQRYLLTKIMKDNVFYYTGYGPNYEDVKTLDDIDFEPIADVLSN